MDQKLFLSAVIEHAIDGIIVADKDGLINMANPSACAMFGYRPGNMAGVNISRLLVNTDIHEAVLAGEQETAARQSDGEPFCARLAASVADHNGQTFYVAIFQDLTDEKIAEKAILQDNERLEAIVAERTETLKLLIDKLNKAKEDASRSLSREQEISKMKSRFVSMASHEFRSPLSSIQLSASLIERYYDRLDKEKVTAHLGKIKAAVADLTNTLNDFLSIEKIESGNIKLSETIFDLSTVTAEICEELSLVKKPGQRIVHQHTGQRRDCRLDRNLLKHCIINLLSNAIKYSDNSGLIKISTSINNGHICVAVRDYGIGIPADDAGNLFSAFFRAGNVGDVPGTGLGLNIVKRYAELMNGNITYVKPKSAGAQFQLCFTENVTEQIEMSA